MHRPSVTVEINKKKFLNFLKSTVIKSQIDEDLRIHIESTHI